MDFLAEHWLDILTTILGLIYIVLEYRASIALWVIGIIMPALDVYLYYSHGLYGDAGMAVYYTVAAIYGYAVWKFGRKHGQKEGEEMPITHFRKKLILPTFAFFLAPAIALPPESTPVASSARAGERSLHQEFPLSCKFTSNP